MLRKLIIGIIVIVIVAGAAIAYLTRPVAGPSQDVQENTEQLEVDEAASAEAVVFRIDQEQSQVEFNIDEVLRGEDFTVVGTTDQIAGDVIVNFTDPSASEVGQIRINARTLKTDSGNRDGAIARFILQSENEDYEFIEFQPTALENLPESVAIGDTLDFQIVGDLTVVDTTSQVTFDASITVDSEEQISGTAETTIKYPDFGLSIPEVPFVASVEDDVLLRISFVASKAE